MLRFLYEYVQRQPARFAYSDSFLGLEESVGTPFSLPGKVYLIGAGPGSADLLTMRAAKLLQSADIVLHDDLVSADVLALISPRATVQSVGKRCGIKKITQEEIHNRMIAGARRGQMIVRLKGGDPLVFGRANEEISALRAAGISFEIVPGITAALAAAAVAQLSLTDRSLAPKMLFVSNHQCGEKASRDWRGGIASDTTLVFYMPGGNFEDLVTELAEAGLALDTPCLIVSNAARPEQEMYHTVLKDLPSAPQFPAPSLLIIGSMAAAPQNHRQNAENSENAEPPAEHASQTASSDSFKIAPKFETRIQLEEEYRQNETGPDNWLTTEVY